MTASEIYEAVLLIGAKRSLKQIMQPAHLKFIKIQETRSDAFYTYAPFLEFML